MLNFQFECHEYKESILDIMPHHWVTTILVFLYFCFYILKLLNSNLSSPPFQDRREDTTLYLAHFMKHKRKQIKKTLGKAVINSMNKPIKHNPQGKDVTNKIAGVLGKAADMAGSNQLKNA
jgi:hypothetical protein